MARALAPIDPSDLGRGPTIVGVSWTFASLAIVAVALRFHVRRKLKSGPGLDDWLMGIAVILNIVSQAFVTKAYHHGLGKHDANLTPPQMIAVLKWMWLANTPGLVVSITARLSIAVLLVRLFGVTHPWLKWFLITVTTICTILTVTILPCTYLQTTPVSGNWNPFVPAKRWDPDIYINLAFTCQALWTFTDLTFVLFPVLIIWRLQMPLRQRLGLAFLMSVSLLTMALSILKTINLKHIATQQANPTATDVQYDATLAILWTCLEQAFVIMMGCVPPLRSITRLAVAKSIVGYLSRIWSSSARESASKSYDAAPGAYVNVEMGNREVPKKEGRFNEYERPVDSELHLVATESAGATTRSSDALERNGSIV